MTSICAGVDTTKVETRKRKARGDPDEAPSDAPLKKLPVAWTNTTTSSSRRRTATPMPYRRGKKTAAGATPSGEQRATSVPARPEKSDIPFTGLSLSPIRAGPDELDVTAMREGE
jgi:hypothetical protein